MFMVTWVILIDPWNSSCYFKEMKHILVDVGLDHAIVNDGTKLPRKFSKIVHPKSGDGHPPLSEADNIVQVQKFTEIHYDAADLVIDKIHLFSYYFFVSCMHVLSHIKCRF